MCTRIALLVQNIEIVEVYHLDMDVGIPSRLTHCQASPAEMLLAIVAFHVHAAVIHLDATSTLGTVPDDAFVSFFPFPQSCVVLQGPSLLLLTRYSFVFEGFALEADRGWTDPTLNPPS